MAHTTRVKVCGVRTPEDALACVAAGVDTLGLNFWPGTPRCVDVPRARAILAELPAGLEVVAVFVDQGLDFVRRVRNETGIAWVQLHGEEPPEDVAALLPYAYKALGVLDVSPLDEVRRFPGEHILLDARVPGAMPGGTGARFDWALATQTALERKLTLAGGLTPDNVAECVRLVRPYRVDVASGVESAPGVKDAEKVQAFVQAVRHADEARNTSM
ncbi:MAG: phosphoribosylanthranilate isomerase [Sandaracinaceae bacterium]|jgi:phosphoribosylanthranilate isomerase|nr:phosphoribosylanthranilate isomerase [Sandaracinaceae bacterium]MBK8409341.1 phosphoribosylanthranilate isomerase [Sandaracinaceae bacterium]MBP7680725.1 phosphoribosylanthranilate isomerase [Deltaproteobacteria bacterium]